MPEISLSLRAPPPELATRAMQRFACLGSTCEDTCCRDFGISMDRDSLDRLRSTAAKDPVGDTKIVRLVVLGLPRDGLSAGQSLVQLDDHGACPLLEPTGACQVHREYGEQLLSTACSVFPRTALAVGDSVEVTGSLACPELARLTLLTEDGLEQDPAPTPVLPRAYIGEVVENDPMSPYVDAFVEVRGALTRLFGCEEFPLGSRLAFAANLAAQVDGFFRQGQRSSTRAERLMLERRLQAELEAAADPESLRSLHVDLQALEGSGEAVVGAVVSMLLERRRLIHAPRFGAVLERAMSRLEADCLAVDGAAPMIAPAAHVAASASASVSFRDEGSPSPMLSVEEVERAVTPARLAQMDRRRRERLEERVPGLMDEVLGRYCRHYLLRNPYTNAGSLMSYLGRLSLSLAAIRLLWTASLDLGDFAPSDTSCKDVSWKDLDRRMARDGAITVIQSFTKAISHHTDFLHAIHEASDRQGGMTFGRLVLFAKFV